MAHPYDEWLEKPYQDAERAAERGEDEEDEPLERDADDWRDEMIERRYLEREEENRWRDS